MKKRTTADFIAQANAKHDGRYTYENTIYQGSHQPIIVTCPIHGDYETKAYRHLEYGCQKCGFDQSAVKRSTVRADFIKAAGPIHEWKYDYSRLDDRIRQHDKVDIICPKHGVFDQAANDHLKGRGCRHCGSEASAILRRGIHNLCPKEFISRARVIHGDRYDYTKTMYRTARMKIVFECPEHGEVHQLPTNHLAGHRCALCSKRVSRVQAEWLDSLNVPEREVMIQAAGRRYFADGFDPVTNTVYEFWGDFWHGNPKVYDPAALNTVTGRTFGVLYAAVQQKRSDILQAGHKLVEVWEYDWRISCAKDSQRDVHTDAS